MRIVVSVSRNFYNYALLSRTIDMAVDAKDKSGIEIVSAHINGAASLILKYCKESNICHKHFNIDNYMAFGQNADRIRVSNMINYALADSGVMFAFWDGCTPCTEHIIRMALNHRMDGYIMNFKSMTFTDLLSMHDMQRDA